MIFFSFLLGLIVGSFLNVCIHRWPDERSVVKPRSQCPRCASPIGWKDNIPVLSYFLLGGKCRECRKSISWRYPAVELANAIIWAALAAKFGWQPFTFKAAAFCSMMLILIFTDLEHMILPDEITKGGTLIGLALSWFIPLPDGATKVFWFMANSTPSPQLASLAESFAGALVFGGMLWIMRELYYRLRGIDGLGLGDVKMAAMMGAFWGVPQTLLILLAGSIMGAVTGTLIVLLARKEWSQELPFGSYLGAAAILTTFFSDELFGAYWQVVMPGGG